MQLWWQLLLIAAVAAWERSAAAVTIWSHRVPDGNALDMILANGTIGASLRAARCAVHEEECPIGKLNHVRLFAFAVLEGDEGHRCAPAQRSVTAAGERAHCHVVLHVHAAFG